MPKATSKQTLDMKSNVFQIRHVGDLGNIEADAQGSVTLDGIDSLLAASSILGRAVVIHEGVDDLGKGGQPDSLTTGHAGGRVACGVIGVANPA